MAKQKRPWTITPHEEIQKLEDNLWAVEGFVPGAKFKRRMCIIKRTDGSLLFFHAIPLEEKALDVIKAWGRPAYLVVGHDQHAFDAEAFREKLGLKVFGPKECEVKLRARLELSGTLEDIPSDPSVRFESVPGVKHGEPIVEVKSAGGSHISLLFGDVIQNSPKDKLPLPLRMLGFGGGPKVVPVFRMLFMKDRAAMKNALLGWAKTPNLVRLVPMHGTIVDKNARELLEAAAKKL